jgi:HEPN domain-containing protein
MKNRIKEWFVVAQEDMRVARALLKEDPVPTSATTFHCQQAIEKYFKAFLLENEWELEKTHDLAYLYQEIKKIKNLNLDEQMISKIYKSYSHTRYPDDYAPPTEEQAREFYKFVQIVGQTIKKELRAKGVYKRELLR